ncbi:MAG: hypothetical protein GF344_08035 [Chitinivibrionales bacterium]|nr:hypothetical protein [Chitinivibrionales bacterium]MBD3356839.1 hypothetical protein [Chitinivibrionales bacterium]
MSHTVDELRRTGDNEEKFDVLFDAMSEQAMGIGVRKQKVSLVLLAQLSDSLRTQSCAFLNEGIITTFLDHFQSIL